MPKNWFSRGRYSYREYDWIPKEEIATRRVARLVAAHERDANAIASQIRKTKKNSQSISERLSRENIETIKKMYDEVITRQKVRLDTNRAAKRRAFQTLLANERAQRTKLSEDGWKKAKAAASDRRQFHPQRGDFDFVASTKYGTIADTVLKKFVYPKMWAKDLPRYLNPTIAIPCIQRHARREVLFAKKLTRKGIHSPKHRNSNSGVPC